jgi:hypothetical protein
MSLEFAYEETIRAPVGTPNECAVHLPFILKINLTDDCDKGFA